jgi:hypothetical protein
MDSSNFCYRMTLLECHESPAWKYNMWWYFTCKHVHYFKIPYFTCTFFPKFTYNEYIGPYFLSHVVLRFLLVNSPSRCFIVSTVSHCFQKEGDHVKVNCHMHMCKESGGLEPTLVTCNLKLVCKPPNLKFHNGLIRNRIRKMDWLLHIRYSFQPSNASEAQKWLPTIFYHIYIIPHFEITHFCFI